jgi:predicted AlkP superfamily pyrophosphatase or phosphodiesterase
MTRAARRSRPFLAAVLAVLLLPAACAERGATPAVAPPAASQPRPAPAPLLVVSFDGFRWDYADRVETPAFDRLAAAGVRAERMIPVFPSRTFPAHYSLATGLYPGHHGVISNNMRDPRWEERFSLGNRAEIQNARWWGGEPIWVTAHRQGLRAGVYFWPGSEAAVQGVRPQWWLPYDGDTPWDVRLDTALRWLTLPESERASFVALYFEEPNDTGHDYGPDAPETRATVQRVDAVLGRLLDELTKRRLDVNVLVVSDHGMAQNDASRIIVLDDYIELFEDEIFEAGAFGQIFPRPGREDAIFAALHGRHPQLAVYRRGAIPPRLGLFDHPRVPPIVLAPAAGWEVMTRAALERGCGHVIAGDHGQDPIHPDMHGILYAAGPGLARGVRLGAVEQVDVYALMCHLLGLTPAPHDGVWDRVAAAVGR